MQPTYGGATGTKDIVTLPLSNDLLKIGVWELNHEATLHQIAEWSKSILFTLADSCSPKSHTKDLSHNLPFDTFWWKCQSSWKIDAAGLTEMNIVDLGQYGLL